MFQKKEYTLGEKGSRAVIATVPWDTKLFNVNVCSLSSVHFDSEVQLYGLLSAVDSKAKALGTDLLITRAMQSDLLLINALENNGFKYIEANYRPCLSVADTTFSVDSNLSIERCQDGEILALSEQVGDMFAYGRYHQDNRIPNHLADLRYQNWLANAAKVEGQIVYKCVSPAGDTIAFFVVERHQGKEAFLSLVGMMRAFRGKGMAKSVWRRMLVFLKEQGHSKVSTSISSHNLAVFNLYVALGFSFPEPELTLHKWYRS